MAFINVSLNETEDAKELVDKMKAVANDEFGKNVSGLALQER